MVGSGVNDLSEVRQWESDPSKRRLVADFYADKLGDIVTFAKNAGI